MCTSRLKTRVDQKPKVLLLYRSRTQKRATLKNLAGWNLAAILVGLKTTAI